MSTYPHVDSVNHATSSDREFRLSCLLSRPRSAVPPQLPLFLAGQTATAVPLCSDPTPPRPHMPPAIAIGSNPAQATPWASAPSLRRQDPSGRPASDRGRDDGVDTNVIPAPQSATNVGVDPCRRSNLRPICASGARDRPRIQSPQPASRSPIIPLPPTQQSPG